VYRYEISLTNGFDVRLSPIHKTNKTFLPASKENRDRFEDSFNGSPLVTGKIAAKFNKIGELGLSYMVGVFNKFIDDGLTLDTKRGVNVLAIDFNTVLAISKTVVNGE
jgi:hypothetical protein